MHQALPPSCQTLFSFAKPFAVFNYKDLQRLHFPFHEFAADGKKRGSNGRPRTKQWAVSEHGNTLRCRTHADGKGYNDILFADEDGAVTLEYVCGEDEEIRRQSKLRSGDRMLIDVRVDKPDETHALLVGTFVKRLVKEEVKPDCHPAMVPHSVIRLEKYVRSSDGDEVPFRQDVPEDASGEGSGSAPSPLVPTLYAQREHLILDTESAAPLSAKTTPNSGTYAFPVLQLAFMRFRDDLTVLSQGCDFLVYDEDRNVGNDANSSVLKFDPNLIATGRRAEDVLSTFLWHVERVVRTGGFVIAHNVAHDVRQVNASLNAAGMKGGRGGGDRDQGGGDVPVPVRTFDTIKTANSFVSDVGPKWLKLSDLADKCGVRPTLPLHHAMSDVVTLYDAFCKGFVGDAKRVDERMDAFCETAEIGA